MGHNIGNWTFRKLMPAPTSESASASTLWSYATQYYDQDGVAELCLRLQDEYGFDVNLLLYCCWYGHCYGTLSETQLKTCFDYSRHWQDNAVKPIRSSRRWLKTELSRISDQEQVTSLTELRERIKRIELELEKQQLETLQALSDPATSSSEPTGSRAAIQGNLKQLCRMMEIDEAAIDGLLGELVERGTA